MLSPLTAIIIGYKDTWQQQFTFFQQELDVFLTISPVQSTFLFTMELTVSQKQQFLCHIFEFYHLSGSQRQQAAASPLISISVACFSGM